MKWTDMVVYVALFGLIFGCCAVCAHAPALGQPYFLQVDGGMSKWDAGSNARQDRDCGPVNDPYDCGIVGGGR